MSTLRLPSDMTVAELESPALALARQDRTERAVAALFDRVLTRFLASVLAISRRDGSATTAGAVFGAWDAAVADEFERSDIPDVVLEYAGVALAQSDLPDVVYSTVRTVLAAGASELWPDRVLNDQLRLALQPDRGEAQIALTAAGYPRHGAQWDKLDSGGMKFMDRMKRDARTAVTGLDGILTSAALGKSGFTRKRWVTMHDDRVRETHAVADGQTVGLDEAFFVGGYPMQHPGDRNAPIGETINCRCVMVGTRWRATRSY